MQGAGITPETDVEAASGNTGKKPNLTHPTPPVGEVNTERLSVFEDFLGKLDLDKLDDKNKPDEEDTSDKPPTDKTDKPKKPKKK